MKLPPYSRPAAQAAKGGYAPTNSIAIAGDWGCRKWPVWAHATWRAVCPPDHEPAEYDWRWVAGFDCIVLGRSQSRVDAITGVLSLAKARLVIGVRPNLFYVAESGA